ncbi:MAG: hypothetical protein R8K22_00645 [Mariprofundaceae bacterium]
MERLTFGQRLSAAIFKPKQVVFLDGESGAPARNMRVRPISIILILLALSVSMLWLGMYYAPITGARNIIPQHMQLQRKHDALQKKYADSQTLNELKDQRIEGLEKEISHQSEQKETLTQRLLMLENIINARKSSGTKILQANAYWSNSSQLNYRLTLVKGGNYPRRISGSIAISTRDPEGNIITLALGESQSKLPYRMETHTFLSGHLIWKESWKPNKLLAIAYNRKGKEVARTEITIEGKVL